MAETVAERSRSRVETESKTELKPEGKTSPFTPFFKGEMSVGIVAFVLIVETGKEWMSIILSLFSKMGPIIVFI